MEISIDNLKIQNNQCCICGSYNELDYKCNRCVSTYICNSCTLIGMEKGVLSKCPVCRKENNWIIITNAKHSKYRYKNNCNQLSKLKKRFNDLLNKLFYIIGFLIFSYLFGTIGKLILNICLDCGNIYINILATFFIGSILFGCFMFIFALCSVCFISCIQVGTPNT